MDRRKFLKNTGWSFLGLAASGQLIGCLCTGQQKDAKENHAIGKRPQNVLGETYITTVTSHTDTAICAMLFEAAKGQLDFVSVTPHAMWPDIPGADDPRLKWVIDYHTGAFKRLREGGYENM